MKRGRPAARVDLPRTYRTWGYPVAPALFLLISTAVGVDVFIISFTKPLIGLFSPLAGLPLYAFIRARNKPDRG